MTQSLHRHADTALCGSARAGAAWIDSGITPGLVVVDSNRPSQVAAGRIAGAARGLLKQFGAAH